MAAGLTLGLAPAATAYGQAFQPQPPADVPIRQGVCRPDAPAVEKTPGLSADVRKGPADCNAISLSFDAGADRGYAEQILDTLRDEEVPASFGMTGLWAQQNTDLVKRMVDEGHELINHTWDHSSFTGYSAGRPMSVAERRLELDRTEELLKGITGKTTRPLFRPPYGDLDNGVLKDVSDDGYDYTIMWTVDSFGWNHLPAAGIIDRCLSRAEPGAIILFHVGIESEDALALKTIITALKERGYALVTVTDLLGL
jgi:peptidoglycan/xylan/chitin deacetylase (PgdA/CDA1 family)